MADGREIDERRIDRVLAGLGLLAAGGGAPILVGGLARLDFAGGLRFIAVGVLAGLTASLVGGALGLLFGLPNARRAAPSADARGDDWYGDSSAMEEIVDWLTKIVIGLGLTQWFAISNQFDRLAGATSRAMGLGGARAPVGDDVKVVGGTILLAYALLGFAAAYLWSRRYLKHEFALSRTEARRPQDDWLKRFAQASAAADLKQGRDGADAPDAASALDAATRTFATREGQAAFLPTIHPGSVQDDPWYGQFGGRARAGLAVIALLRPITPLPGGEVFAVYPSVHGVDSAARTRLVGHGAWIYLHPTFPDPIRKLDFDAQGEIRLPLECWGSFTIGVQLEDGTLLELRLGSDPSAPQAFRDR